MVALPYIKRPHRTGYRTIYGTLSLYSFTIVHSDYVPMDILQKYSPNDMSSNYRLYTINHKNWWEIVDRKSCKALSEEKSFNLTLVRKADKSEIKRFKNPYYKRVKL